MKHAFVFPGQGSQFPGMGKSLYDADARARDLFGKADHILGFSISDTMFTGTAEALKQTNVTQPAVFLHATIAFLCHGGKPDMVAGHSLGEFSALVANGVLDFEDALKLVVIRSNAMQQACERHPSTMAAVLGLEDARVEELCAEAARESSEVVVPANYNCPGQVVISGTQRGVELAGERLKAAGAKRVLPLPVGGAFHSPLMEPARLQLQQAIENTTFHQPSCPIYQNVSATAVDDADTIRQNLVNQLTGAVRWTQSVQAMVADGATRFTEFGPGKVLQGLIAKISREAETDGVS
ncbi:ACP S-malonyltransferase [Compostibacter hankyongensis]|uniref:Malonyl CoA-acyl carrier protein transacylase n=1 Tax=Compostibacter hankyongensis TaxID=1007089 RepID=A0ABP8FFP1_9BACT